MLDKREAILLRLFAILETVTNGAEPIFVFRNRGEVPDEKYPALVLLDGSEDIRISATGKGGILAPTVFTLQPQVFVMLKPTYTVNNDGVGPALSDYRMKLLKAFTSDDNLFAMLGSNGEMQYTGHQTDMQTGSTMLGQMLMQFSISYVLNPSDY